MKKIVKYISIIAVVLSLLTTFAITANAENYTTYTYSYDARYQISPDAFTTEGEYSVFDNVPLKKPSDIVSDLNGRVIISDTGNNRIVISEADFSSAISVYSYIYKGESVNFLEPTGLCVTENDLIYVADTGNSVIVILNPDGTTYSVFDHTPTNAQLGGFSYTPVAVGVDSLERVFILSRDTPGLILMDKNGEFQGVIGAQDVTVDFSDYIWRMFMTREQIMNSKQYVPITYNNLFIDHKGFIYVTSYVEDGYALQQAIDGRESDSDSFPIRKLTSDGTDVLKRNGFFPPVGDVNFEIVSNADTNAKTHSSLSAVTVRENGVYSLVDSKYGKIFTYDEDGNLLYAFGGKGSKTGLFENLISLNYRKTDLLALDNGRGSVTLFKMTEYGKLLDQTVILEQGHKYSELTALWDKILEKNNNFDLAYYSIGKNFLEQKDYSSAMEYFKLINNTTYYSKALQGYREEFLSKWFLLVPIVIVLVVIIIAKLFGIAKKYNYAERYNKGKRGLKSHLMYSTHVIFHPFDGFSDIKCENRGGVLSASIIFVFAIVTLLVNSLFSGYLFNEGITDFLGIITSFGNLLVPFMLYMLSNWCLTSLMDGKGNMKQIYTTMCYSLVPIILLLNVSTVLSHFLVIEESAFITTISSIAYLWTIMLIFFGTMTIHDYGLGKNIVVTALGIVGIAVMLFVILLFANVIGRVTTFITNIYNEISFRM